MRANTNWPRFSARRTVADGRRSDAPDEVRSRGAIERGRQLVGAGDQRTAPSREEELVDRFDLGPHRSRWKVAFTNHSYAHEIGHLFGMDHDEHNNSNRGTGNLGCAITKNGVHVARTIMSSSRVCKCHVVCPRWPVYSSPHASKSGYKYGGAANNNKRMLLENAPKVSRFRRPPSAQE